jgi:hypothetical protein
MDLPKKWGPIISPRSGKESGGTVEGPLEYSGGGPAHNANSAGAGIILRFVTEMKGKF